MPYEHHRLLSRSAAVRRLARGAIALCMAVAMGPSLAQASDAAGYPRKPIRLIVPFTVGGSTDILARAIGQQLTQAWGQAVIVDNVPGAGGSIGADKVAKAPADGYTLLMGHIGSLAVTPSLYPRLPYDPVKAFAAVAWIARVPNVLVVHPSVPAKTVDELVAYAKTNPGKLNYGSGGNGSAAHIATEYLKLKTGAPISHVPYRGTSPAVNDLLAGQIQVMFTGVPAVLAQVKAGQLRAIAVSSVARVAALPEVPTVAEAGLPGFEADQWYGIVAPAGTPTAVIARLNQQINASLNVLEVADRLIKEGAIPTPSTPETFARLISTEIPRWKQVVQNGKIVVE